MTKNQFRAVAVSCSLLVLALPGDAPAQSNDVSCCMRASSELHSYLNPAIGEDHGFFTGGSGNTAQVVMAFMNRAAMRREFPYNVYEMRLKGGATAAEKIDTNDANSLRCGNTMVNGFEYFYPHAPALQGPYDSSKVYPPPEFAYAGDNQSSKLFNPTKAYRNGKWNNQCAQDGDCGADSFANICAAFSNAAECQSCLSTRGYYFNPDPGFSDNGTSSQREKIRDDEMSAAFAGNWLNFHPPKFVLLRLALRKVVTGPLVSQLRISVVTNLDGNGGRRLDDFRPSCNGNGSPSGSFINNLSSILFDDDHNPISEVLFNIGQYYSRLGRYYGGANPLFSSSSVCKGPCDTNSSAADEFSEKSGSSRSICRDCDKNFVVLFSDGRSDEGNTFCDCANTAAGGDCVASRPPRGCARPSQSTCNVAGSLGLDDDGNSYVVPADAPSVTGPGVRQRLPGFNGTCEYDFADDVADFLERTDFNPDPGFPSKNNVVTYAVGVGHNDFNRMTVLQQVATRGTGQFIGATNYAALETGLRSLVDDINRRATSFSGASVSPLQVSSGATSLVPRFNPDNSPLWKGKLFRWGVYNEFVEDSDLNGDGDKGDVFTVQYKAPPAVPTSADIVVEDNDGNFVLQTGGAPATPYWEAGAKLNTLGHAGRTIYTALLTHSDGGVVAFTPANAALIEPYLALAGTGDCADLSARLMSASQIAAPLTQTECAEKLIEFVRGKDILDQDGDGDYAESRPWLLGDIFHSSPALVEPPADNFLCGLGLSAQCSITLYDQNLPKPTPIATDGGTNAYEHYRNLQLTRPRVALVGANDGMLHAFNAGTALASPPAPTASNPLPATHDDGTGNETWAFIPPDLLPKLKEMLKRRQYYVDGDTMVKDIWVDLDGDNVKQVNEFRTIAVISERRGGTHYTALDVTDTTAPKWLWTFPEACTKENLEVGESWMSLSPKPPPIGPVLLKKTGGVVRQGVETEERWIVFLQGGYDPNHARGHGLYMLDAWSGKLLFKRQFADGVDLSRNLTAPIAAPVAMIDFGSGTAVTPDQDGYFDTAVVGDTLGQMHIVRFHQPGVLDNTGKVTNWFMARTFEQDSSDNPRMDDDLEDPEPGDGKGIVTRNPFFQIAANTIQLETGALRTYLGTGDRYNLRDPGPGQCRADNPLACAKYGCEWSSRLEVDLPVRNSGGGFNATKLKSHSHFEDRELKHYKNSFGGGTSTAACVLFSAKQTVELTGCPGSLSPGDIKDRSRICSAVATPLACIEPTALLNNQVHTNNSFSASGLSRNRFYGFWSYGMSKGGVSRTFSTAAQAATFDSNRLREVGYLRDVTDITANAAGGITSSGDGGTPANENDWGWRLSFNPLAERTASGSAIIGGCVLWNTLEANTAVSACGASQSNQIRLYQSHYVTGAPTCAASFSDGGVYVRNLTRNSIAPPGEPSTVVSLSKTGQIKYGVQAFEPGGTQAVTADVSLGGDLFQTVYTLPISRPLHNCRHGDAGCE